MGFFLINYIVNYIQLAYTDIPETCKNLSRKIENIVLDITLFHVWKILRYFAALIDTVRS